MKSRFLILGVIVLGAVLAAAFFLMWRSTPHANAVDNPYAGLRAQALAMPPSEIGLMVTGDQVWGVLMELPVSKETATVVAFADGSASIYLSSGGGFIGGGERPPVRRSAEAFLAAARAASASFAPAAAFPPPGEGRVRFYVRVGEAAAAAEAGEQELGSGGHPLSALYAAGQGVITAYRDAGGDR